MSYETLLPYPCTNNHLGGLTRECVAPSRYPLEHRWGKQWHCELVVGEGRVNLGLVRHLPAENWHENSKVVRSSHSLDMGREDEATSIVVVRTARPGAAPKRNHAPSDHGCRDHVHGLEMEGGHAGGVRPEGMRQRCEHIEPRSRAGPKQERLAWLYDFLQESTCCVRDRNGAMDRIAG